MSYKTQIQQNAATLVRLREQLLAAIAKRYESEESRARWSNACKEFHEKYQELAFPGGTRDMRERLRAGDEQAINYALDFIEVRPYFFRSGYMYNDFVRVLRNCPLSPKQQIRYDRFRERFEAYRRSCKIRAYYSS